MPAQNLSGTVVFAVFIERASANIGATATVGRSTHVGENKCQGLSRPTHQPEKPFQHRWSLLRWFNSTQQRRATQFVSETGLRIPEIERCHMPNVDGGSSVWKGLVERPRSVLRWRPVLSTTTARYRLARVSPRPSQAVTGPPRRGQINRQFLVTPQLMLPQASWQPDSSLRRLGLSRIRWPDFLPS